MAGDILYILRIIGVFSISSNIFGAAEIKSGGDVVADINVRELAIVTAICVFSDGWDEVRLVFDGDIFCIFGSDGAAIGGVL